MIFSLVSFTFCTHFIKGDTAGRLICYDQIVSLRLEQKEVLQMLFDGCNFISNACQNRTNIFFKYFKYSDVGLLKCVD